MGGGGELPSTFCQGGGCDSLVSMRKVGGGG